MPIDPNEGGGPWTFEAPALSANERFSVYLPSEPNPQDPNTNPGWFRPYLPLDEAKVYNLDSSNLVTATFNNRYEMPVPPNGIETFRDQGIRSVSIVNQGGTTIAAEDVKVVLAKNPWNADKAARAKRNAPWPQRALSDIIPGGLL